MIDKAKLSRSGPTCRANEWPLADRDAIVALVEASAERPEPHVVDRVTAAAGELGVRPRHRPVVETLAGVFGKFPLRGGL